MLLNNNLLIIIFIIFSMLLTGCAVTQSSQIKSSPHTQNRVELSKESLQDPIKQNLKSTLDKSIVFFKTDFKGILETNYVRLSICPDGDVSKQFDIHLGDISKVALFSGENEALKPGYIYLELPIGEYRIVSISIPVGTTLAEEKLNLEFTVKKEVVNYLGTLSLDGTKERIKLGGVPVIQPGFDYNMEVRDERKEAFINFHQKYPDVKSPKNVGLLQIGKNG